MKPISSLPRAGIVIFAIALAGCGQKGPLFLPKKPAPTASTAPAKTPVAPERDAAPEQENSTERDAAPESK